MKVGTQDEVPPPAWRRVGGTQGMMGALSSLQSKGCMLTGEYDLPSIIQNKMPPNNSVSHFTTCLKNVTTIFFSF